MNVFCKTIEVFFSSPFFSVLTLSGKHCKHKIVVNVLPGEIKG